MPTLSPHSHTQLATAPPTTADGAGGHRTRRAGRGPTMMVVASLLVGLLSALALVVGPFADGSESQITGALLLGFAAGWALLGGGWVGWVPPPPPPAPAGGGGAPPPGGGAGGAPPLPPRPPGAGPRGGRGG